MPRGAHRQLHGRAGALNVRLRRHGGDSGACSDLLRVPFADAMLLAAPCGLDPTVIASASDNIPDAWRTVAPHLAAMPERRC